MNRRATVRSSAALLVSALVTLPITAGALAADGDVSAVASDDGTANGTTDKYAPHSLPFALPGFKEQEFDGALLVGEGHARFSLAFNMVTPAGRVLDDNMVPWIKRIGTVTPDGSYYEIDMTTDNRTVTPETIGALRAVLAHPEDWTRRRSPRPRSSYRSRRPRTRRSSATPGPSGSASPPLTTARSSARRLR